MRPPKPSGNVVPPRALVLSVLALGVPLSANLLVPEWLAGDGALLVWLPALLPAFLLTYYRGWTGASQALAGGMAALALSQAEVLWLGVEPPGWTVIGALVGLFAAVSVGAGWLGGQLRSERAAAEASALSDPLTELPNRRHATVFLETGWGGALRGRGLAVVVFDLDDFKEVNDRNGHAEGDRVLKAFADILRDRTRRMDLSARFGGEEFITVLVDCTMDRATAFAEEVRARTRALTFPWGGITVSAGVAAFEDGMGSPDVLVAAADRALYAAKDSGRDSVRRADESLAPSRLPARRREPRTPPPTDLHGLRVHVVDDDRESLAATARLLERFGCVVWSSGSSRDALELLRDGAAPDVLMTDIVMPEMSGFTLVDIASKLHPGLPVLYVSGYPRQEVYWGGTPGSRSAFLSKPVEPGDLRGTLLELLGVEPPETDEAFSPDEAGRPGPTRARAVVERPTLSGRILIVDDDEDLVRALQRLFQRTGYEEPIGLTDPKRVRHVLLEEDVDLIILDVHMPQMDGLEVLSAIAPLIGPEEFLPVLILTADDQPDLHRRALSAGAHDFLRKPFDPAEAEARVRNLLSTRFLTLRVARQKNEMEEQVVKRTKELADTRSEILHRLARAAEYRDDMTGRHAERVGLLSSLMASELGMSPREVDLIRRTAPLHDIGKIGVPDAILKKPGRLTPSEFELMKTHTTIGAQILGGSGHPLLIMAREIAQSHHERWDGRGYPFGLEGPDIPRAARIVAVADTFDTLSHDRPYKSSVPPDRAVEEIVRCRELHYDPNVVDAFLGICDRVGPDGLNQLADPIDPLRDTIRVIPTEPQA